MQVLDSLFPTATLHVGPGQAYPTISAAITAAQEGDTLLVQAGTYTDDFAAFGTRVTFKAVGGMVVLEARA
jgi:hypothetical protein